MSNKPLVTIIIPVYNGSNYLSEAIKSAIAQTYENVEIIVINDGSNDNGKTRDVALSFGNAIKYLEKSNGGVASALNVGIANMKGDYFSWLSHDDIYYPNKIQTQIDFFSFNPAVRNSILYSDFEIVDQDLNILQQSELKKSDAANFSYWLTTNSDIHGCTLLIPKSCFLEVGNFPENLMHTQDYSLWFKFSKYFNFVLQKEILVQSRQHVNQGSKVENLNSERRSEIRKMRIGFLYDLANEEIIRAEGVNLLRAYIRLLRKLNNHKLPYIEYYILKIFLKNLLPIKF